MNINLQKGQKIDLTKGRVGLSKILVGLGWDPISAANGFFKGLFSGISSDFDCDVSVLMLDSNGKLLGDESLIYYGHLKSSCGSVTHTGDNLTGDGKGDNEQIIIELDKIPQQYNKLIFVVNIFDCLKRKQHFGLIKNAFIRIADVSANQELVRFNLSEKNEDQTTLFAGEIYRHDGEWKFEATGNATAHTSLNEIIKEYEY